MGCVGKGRRLELSGQRRKSVVEEPGPSAPIPCVVRPGDGDAAAASGDVRILLTAAGGDLDDEFFRPHQHAVRAEALSENTVIAGPGDGPAAAGHCRHAGNLVEESASRTKDEGSGVPALS